MLKYCIQYTLTSRATPSARPSKGILNTSIVGQKYFTYNQLPCKPFILTFRQIIVIIKLLVRTIKSCFSEDSVNIFWSEATDSVACFGSKAARKYADRATAVVRGTTTFRGLG